MIVNSRKYKNRKKLRVVSDRPRLSVFRSNKFIYAQVIDDKQGRTVAMAKGVKPDEVGAKVASASIAAGVKRVVFDRGNSRYLGKVRSLAEAARSGGLEF